MYIPLTQLVKEMMLNISALNMSKLLQWLPLLATDPDPSPAVEECVSERQCMQQALDALAPKYRVPLILYTNQRYSVGEVAQILNISAKIVRPGWFED